MVFNSQPDGYDPRQDQRYAREQQYGQLNRYDAQQQYRPQQHEAPLPQPQLQVQAIRKAALTAAEKFWYVIGNISLGAMYFAKIPAKKALADFGLTDLTTAEGFWYILMCIPFGAGYFAKIPAAKAISELDQFRAAGYSQLDYSR